MQRTRVKFCGLTRVEDLRAACALGADAVGFVCFPGSPRFVPPDRLAGLAQAVMPLVTPVLLFVNASAADVERGLAAVPQALLQFHGAEDPEFCGSFGRPYLRALAMDAGVDLLEFERRFSTAAAVLADAPAESPAAGGGAVPGAMAGTPAGAAFGGTGRTFPWDRLAAPERRRLPLILAGGLQADNVAEAVYRVRPYAVDVSSGVEASRGVKSAGRMRDFLAAVRLADARADANPDGCPDAVHGGAA
jgi:phosphoribosylanthranilate isomerase